MKTTRITIGKPYKFNCVKCGGIMDRDGKVCCNCLLFSNIKAIEKQKAELRAISVLVKQQNPKLIEKMKEEARYMAVSRIGKEYGVRIK